MIDDTGAPLVQTSRAGGVLTLRLNRPAALNALTSRLLDELLRAVRRAARDPEIRVVVLTGAGRAFCVGQDLKQLDLSADRAAIGAQLRDLLRTAYNPLIDQLTALEKPVVAAVNGAAAGAGMSLALACDLRVASTDATFVTAFGAIGLVPDSGALLTLPRLVGPARAFELMALSTPTGAEEALRLGLVNQVFEAERFDEQVQTYAEKLAAGPPLALGLLKRGLARAAGRGLGEVLEIEALLQEQAGRSRDFQEGATAFLEKRRPTFVGE